MAGLGECCSHIAGTLFALESAVSIANNKSCTDIQQSWHRCLLPKALQFKRACEIDFAEPATKRRKVSFATSTTSCSSKFKYASRRVDGNITSEKAKKLYSALHASGGNSVVLSAIDEYSDNYAPKSIELPGPLSNLYKPEHLEMNFFDVLEISHNVFHSMNFTSAQVNRLLSKQHSMDDVIYGSLISINY